MLEQMVKSVISKTLAADYPHLTLPAVAYAIISSARQLTETYTIDGLVIINDESGSRYSGHVVAPWYEYSLTIIDRFGNVDEDFPALPEIKSKKQFRSGAVVAIAFAYGDISPEIIGEVVL